MEKFNFQLNLFSKTFEEGGEELVNFQELKEKYAEMERIKRVSLSSVPVKKEELTPLILGTDKGHFVLTPRMINAIFSFEKDELEKECKLTSSIINLFIDNIKKEEVSYTGNAEVTKEIELDQEKLFNILTNKDDKIIRYNEVKFQFRENDKKELEGKIKRKN